MPQDRVADPMSRGPEMDYVACFDALARVEVEIRRQGPSTGLLLRRAMLEMAIGNYVGALDAARDAVTSAPREAEAHYQEGLAWMWLARVQVGSATLGPGSPLPTRRPLRVTLQNAYDSFCASLECAPGDAEAEAAARFVEHMLELPDESLSSSLHAQH